MAPALRLRITAFAVLVVISFAVNAPSVHSAVESGTLGRGAGDAAGIHNAGPVASPAPADDAAAQYAFLDDSVVMTTFDTSAKYASHVMGIHDAGPVIGFASPVDDAAMEQASLDNSGASAQGGTQGGDGSHAPGLRNAGPTGGSAAAPQQHASLRGSRAVTDIGQQAKGFGPATGSSPAGRLPNVASPAGGEAEGVRPNPGEGDGLDPFVYGTQPDTNDLIDPPAWVAEPTAGDSAPGSAPGGAPAAGCQSAGTCNAPLPTASNVVPEPGSVALLGLGLIGVALSRRRKAAVARQ